MLYQDRGAPGFIVEQNGKYRVLIACYGNRDNAESVRARLLEKQSVETFIYEWSAPEVEMQMSGAAGQLDVVEAALSLPNTTAMTLRDLAIGCDKGEYTFDEAANAVSGMSEQLSLLANTLKERFPRPYPDFVTLELEQLSNTLVLLEDVADCETITDFSARLKLASMTLYTQLIEFRNHVLDM